MNSGIDKNDLTLSSRRYGIVGFEEALGERTLGLDTNVAPWPQHYWYRYETVPHGGPQVLVGGVIQSNAAELRMSHTHLDEEVYV